MIRSVMAECGIDLDRGPHGDVWGSSMGVLFGIADALYAAGESIPGEWQYRHGPSQADLDPDEDYEAIAFTGAVEAGRLTWDNVRHMGRIFDRYTRALDRAGRSY